MPTVLSPPEQRVVLRNISWETYERLPAENADCSNPRLTYDRGILEIMSPSAEHAELSRAITLLVNVVTEELEIDVRGFGSTIFRREDLARGFEPDSCFYIQYVEDISGKSTLDFVIDPPPDLIIEVDLTNASLNKFSIYAQVGVPEIWRYDGIMLHVFHLASETYVVQEASGATSQRIVEAIGPDGRLPGLDISEPLPYPGTRARHPIPATLRTRILRFCCRRGMAMYLADR